MDTLHAQKENVDTNAAGGGGSSKLHFADPDTLSTPKRGFVVHQDSKSSGRKGLKDRSSNKSRRVLSDISNKQRNRQRGNNSSGIASAKKVGLGEGLGQSKKLSAKKKTKTPLKTKAVASLTPKAVIEPPEVPDIEFAYGGLPSPEADSAYLKGLRDEILQDIINDKTPTLFDDFDPAGVVDDWSSDKAMLESGEPPSPWWSKASEETDLQEEQELDPVLDDVPPPDVLPDDTLDNFDADELLGDLLSVDVEAACSE